MDPGSNAHIIDLTDEEEPSVQWPLPYRICLPASPPRQTTLTSRHEQYHPGVKKLWWSHELYRGPDDKPVEIFYSKDRLRSEELAQMFLNESIIGFDMEWPVDWKKRSISQRRRRATSTLQERTGSAHTAAPWPEKVGPTPVATLSHKKIDSSQAALPLQQRIGLMQVATPDKIALFHIGLHIGKTTDDIIAPSLRKLIESPTIVKTGVAVLNADFKRIKRYFQLKPKAAFDLSHLHRLIEFSEHPEFLSTKPTSLAKQVEKHLGLPLLKGKERCSNWSEPLDQAQIRYAAADAYAGIMLYHCMNAKRVALRLCPPIPQLADLYPSGTRNWNSFVPLRLQPSKVGDEDIIARAYCNAALEKFRKEITSDKATDGGATTDAQHVPREKAVKRPLDPSAQSLFDRLAARRETIAQGRNVPVYRIISNTVLEGIARQQPMTIAELLAVKGVGIHQQKTYGPQWLEVIAQHRSAQELFLTAHTSDSNAVSGLDKVKLAGCHQSQGQQGKRSESGRDSLTVPQTASKITPLLHSGLSFSLAETTLVDDKNVVPQIPGSVNSAGRRTIETLDLTGDFPDSYEAFNETAESPRNIEAKNTLYSKSSSSSPDMQLKRKRTTTVSQDLRLCPPPTKEREQTVLSARIFRNKLQAFSKRVTRKISSQESGIEPIVSECTLDLIVVMSPTNQEELDRVPNIESFALACKQAELDLLRNIIKFMPDPP